jgi:hypothetical protein
VRRWHRNGDLHAGCYFSNCWTWNGEVSAHIDVRTETDAVALTYRWRSPGAAEWKSAQQRVPLTWTACHFGGRRPWFICPIYSAGRCCERRVAVLYEVGGLFGCRRCCGLAYTSQQETPMYRGLAKAQKIRQRLEGSTDIFDAFPGKPKSMRWTTYDRLRLEHNVAKERALKGIARTERRLPRFSCSTG